MCRSRLSRLFLGFNRQRRRTARERGQGTSLGSFVGTSLVGGWSVSQLHSNAGCTSLPRLYAGWQTHARNENRNPQTIARSDMQKMRRKISKKCPVRVIYSNIYTYIYNTLILFNTRHYILHSAFLNPNPPALRAPKLLQDAWDRHLTVKQKYVVLSPDISVSHHRIHSLSLFQLHRSRSTVLP